MIGYLVVSYGDITYSNGINKSLYDAKEDILGKKLDVYFFRDVIEGYFVSNLNNISRESDFDIAVDGYIDMSEWVISINIDTQDINTYYNGVLIK